MKRLRLKGMDNKLDCAAVERCIKTTFSYSSDTRYGVMLEKELGVLIDRQNIKDFSLL